MLTLKSTSIPAEKGAGRDSGCEIYILPHSIRRDCHPDTKRTNITPNTVLLDLISTQYYIWKANFCNSYITFTVSWRVIDYHQNKYWGIGLSEVRITKCFWIKVNIFTTMKVTYFDEFWDFCKTQITLTQAIFLKDTQLKDHSLGYD